MLPVAGIVEPALPPHCEPSNDFLYRFSSTFHTCVPTNLAFISTLLGSLSIVAWLFAQLPQIWKNFQLHSTSGLSVFFLGEWLLGDLSNLLGSIFTKQATWQIVIACYYCFVDCMLMGQYIWYEGLKHGRPLRSVWWPRSKENRLGGNDVFDGMSIYSQSTLDSESGSSKPIDAPNSKNLRPPEIRGQFRIPRFSASPAPSSPSESSLSSTPTRITRITAGTSPAPSPRTVLYISLVLAIVAQASPLQRVQDPELQRSTATQLAGKVLSWLSTLMYLGSRLPQLYKNHKHYSSQLSSEISSTAHLC